jgi:2,3-bisphosphoglycerate-dependent phosphoglycerate mutase
MQLFLVRHGQSFNNTLPDGSGRVDDPPLTEIGLKQAPLVARHLAEAPAKDPHNKGGVAAGFGITKLFTSAMLRCLQTSAPIAEALDLDPEIWVDVHEECGIWLEGVEKLPGLTRSEIADQFPRVVIPDEIGEDGWWNRPRETETEWLVRAQRVADRLWSEFADTDERLAVVAHGGFIKDLVSVLIAGGPLSPGIISSRNTSVTCFSFVEGQLVVGYLNRIDHLSAEWVT